MIPVLDLKAQLSTYREQAISAMIEVMDSQTFIMGPKVDAFEKHLGEFLGLPKAVGVSSGTDALLVALMALDLKAGDEVIMPALSFFATAGVVARLGAKPVFVDIHPHTYLMQAEDCAKAITSKTKAIIPVHLFGQTCDLGDLYEDSSVPTIIEDSAQAIGAKLRGKGTGMLGTLCATSFFPSKNLGGFGDGGAIYGRNEELLEKCRILRVHGAKQKYHHTILGGNFRLDAMQAAILDIKLQFLNTWAELRRRNADRYDAMFAQTRLVEDGHLALPQRIVGAEHVFNQYTIKTSRRDDLKKHLLASGIETMIYYPSPLHTQPCFSELGYQLGDFPEAEKACHEVISIPVYPELTEAEQQYIVDTIQAFFS